MPKNYWKVKTWQISYGRYKFPCVIWILFIYDPLQKQGTGDGKKIPRKTAIFLKVV